MVQILLIDNGTTLLSKLQRLIPGEESVVHFSAFDGAQTSKSDAIVLSGSSMGPLYGNKRKYRNEIDFIRNTRKPIIGICFGYELIVHAFGGTLKELPGQKVGDVAIKVLRNKELFGGRDVFITYENHRWGADKLPGDFEILAESSHGPEVIRHKTRPVYGLQFHPENHIEKSFGDELFINILNELTS